MGSYYSDKNFLNIAYSIDISLFTHFAGMLFNDDETKIIYSSNAYAFRNRSEDNSGNLSLPFLNFRIKGYAPGERMRWNLAGYSLGVYVEEIEKKIQFAPITISYEASFWCNRDDELRYAFSELVYDSDNKTVLAPAVTVDSEDILFPAHVLYHGLAFDPTYDETDWIEKNKIHSASLDFNIETLALKTNANICIPTSFVFNFAQGQDYDDPDDYESALQFTIDHLNETVEET